MQIEFLKTLLENALTERNTQRQADLFVVELKLKPGNVINIFIDAFDSVSIDDCIAVSRYVEGNLDREKEDFELQVSSAGLDQPFKVLAQYKKNIGKKVKVLTKEGTSCKGELLAANEESFDIKPEVKAKKKAKTPEVDEGPKHFNHNEVKEVRIIIEF